jgi:hypothetical protein
MLMYGGVSTFFGLCGTTPETDTVLAKQQWFLKQGSMPLDYPATDCPPHPVTCHTQQIVNTTFTVAPIPALMVPVKASPRTVQFSSVQYQPVTFTTGADPAEIFIGGRLNGIPVTPTSWVYTAGDGTLDGNMCGGGQPYYPCTPYLHKAGRMVVKAFIAGWEQTSTVTVQCLVTPADSLLNDTTSDFGLREVLLDALAKSNADSAAGLGATAEHHGFRHEEGGRIFQWTHGPKTGQYFFVPVDDPNATECHVNVQLGEEENPILGATVVGHYHVHVVTAPDSIYGCTPSSDGRKTSQYPGDGLRPYYVQASDSIEANYNDGGGSFSDWLLAIVPNPGRNEYVIWKDGTVYRLSRRVDPLSKSNPDHWSAFGAARDATKPAGKCTWPKKYIPS